MTIVLGLGATALVGSTRRSAPPTRPATPPSRCSRSSSAAARAAPAGTLLFAITSAIAFATILAVVAGLTLASSVSFAHDLYAQAFRSPAKAPATDRQEVVVARLAARA